MTGYSEDVLLYRDVVFGNGQSNLGCYGDLLGVWPQTQRYDESVGLASDFMFGFGNVPGAWGNWGMARASQNIFNTRGCLGNSLTARMRGLGLRPSMCFRWQGGATSQMLLDGVPALVTWFNSQLALQRAPRSLSLIWDQGEAEAYLGTGEVWLANTRAAIAAVRTGMNLPTLHLHLVRLANVYTPGGELPYLSEVIAAQEELVATDPHASLCAVAHVKTVTNNIHLGQPSLDKQAAIIAQQIRSRVGVL